MLSLIVDVAGLQSCDFLNEGLRKQTGRTNIAISYSESASLAKRRFSTKARYTYLFVFSLISELANSYSVVKLAENEQAMEMRRRQIAVMKTTLIEGYLGVGRYASASQEARGQYLSQLNRISARMKSPEYPQFTLAEIRRKADERRAAYGSSAGNGNGHNGTVLQLDQHQRQAYVNSTHAKRRPMRWV